MHYMEYTVPYHVRDIHTDTLSHECVTTTFVDDLTLLVHYVIVLKETLTDTEVVFLNFLLCTLN